MHPFLHPGSWLLAGDYFPARKSAQHLTGVTETRTSEQFPETLRVEGEIRDAGNPGARPVRSAFHLDVVATDRVRFRMDSQPLGTVLVGGGHFDAVGMVVRYGSPDRRILGFESYVSVSADEIRYSGVLLADGAPLTSWLARLERVAEGERAGRKGKQT